MHLRLNNLSTYAEPSVRALAVVGALAACLALGTPLLADTPSSATGPDAVDTAVETDAAIVDDGSTTVEEGRAIVKVVRLEDPAAEAVAPQGLVVVRDQETGELRAPSAAEWSELSINFDPLNRSAAGLEQIYYADGTIGVRLDGRFQSMSTVDRTTDGSHAAGCTHSVETLSQLMVQTEAERAEAATEQTEEVRDVR